MTEPSGFDDDWNDCPCLGDVECGNPLCVAEREAAAEERTEDPDEFSVAS